MRGYSSPNVFFLALIWSAIEPLPVPGWMLRDRLELAGDAEVLALLLFT